MMLRLLMLEDDALAAELTLHALNSAGVRCTAERVVNETDFRAALTRAPDIVVSDSDVPGFDGMAALAILKCERPETPFIFVSAHLDESTLRYALDNGATDFVAKSDLTRLPNVIRSALPSATRSRRASDEPGAARRAGAGNSADYLLQRQATVERVLRPRDGTNLAGLLSRAPPAPAALLMIGSPVTSDRYVKLLHTADIEIELARDERDALARLAVRVPALLFTDRLDLIHEARQLYAASTIHMVFISAGDEGSAVQGLRAGANDVMPADGRGEQFWAHLSTARRIVSFAASLQSAITNNRLLATIDELTRVGTRRYFEDQWPKEVAGAVRLGRPLSLVLCDIDHFKGINDREGHRVGDEVLSEFGERLTKGLRLGEDWVARIGGEEFAIVLPEAARFQARAIAERLRESISDRPFLRTSLGLSVTASFGICSLEHPAEPITELHEQLVKLADSALYDSKRAGRNRVTEVIRPSSGTGAAGQA